MSKSRLPRVLTAVAIGSLVLLLLVDGLTTKSVGAAGTNDTAAARAPVSKDGPILSSSNNRLVRKTQRIPDHVVALTFDDGPDPHWTPKVAKVLKAAGVPATFFEVGSQIERYPWATRLLLRDGFEIGNHTFTHGLLTSMPNWERQAQLNSTEQALVGAAGVFTTIVRPPYSSLPDAVTPADNKAWAQMIAPHNLKIVLSTKDTEDWSQPGVSSIVSSAIPAAGHGAVVLFHDAGGRRTQTIAALPKVIAALKRRGYSFVTVGALAGLSSAQVNPKATSGQHFRGATLLLGLRAARWVTAALTVLVFVVMAVVLARILATVALAIVDYRRRLKSQPTSSFVPPVSIIVPAHNEAVGIERAVRSLVETDYPGPIECIVVDDGSTDGTAQIVRDLKLPNVSVVEQANTGKHGALNHGLKLAVNPIVIMVDGDTVFEPNTVLELVQPLRDPGVAAVAGNPKVGNRGGILGRWQHLEYVMGINLDRRALAVLGAITTVPGAVGAYRASALEQVGGVPGGTLAEDTDLVLALGAEGWRIEMAPTARAWTEAPATLRGLWRQRTRWAYGSLQALWRHRRSVLGRGPGASTARRTLGYLALFQVILPLCGPLVDLFAIYSILFLNPVPIIIFLAVFMSLQLISAAVALKLDGERIRSIWALPLQQIVYRQLAYLVVMEAVSRALLGEIHGWGKLRRLGNVEVLGSGSKKTATE